MTAEISIECHAGSIPSFAATELDRLYGNIYSSLVHFRLFGGLEEASTYVARCGNEVLALFLFRVEQGRVRVLNEGMQLPAEEVRRFVSYIFHGWPSVSVIEFHAVHADLSGLPLPCQRFYWNEDYLLQLPGSPDEYMAMLGSATRKNIRKHLNRWQRDFPQCEFQVYEQMQIDEQQLRDIVGFNRIRMAAKNRISAIDEGELQQLLRLARECGLLCVLTVDGRVCAGALLFRFGDHYVSRITAHDPAANEYRLGTIACYLAICECIRRGGRWFHFMWGRYEYKAALGGQLCELDHIAIYRSYWHLLRNAGLALQITYQGYGRTILLWLQSQQGRGNGLLPKVIGNCVHVIRQLKRFGQRRPVS